MSIESAKAFYQRITTDEAFNTEYENASSDEERQDIITSAGYDFTSEEWEAALADSNSSEEELSDAELAEVSGGKGIIPRDFPPRIRPWLPKPTKPKPFDPGPRPMYGSPIDFD